MYDRHLDAFLMAADCGSFTKASEKLFTSPNALIKQVNLLEEKLGFALFQRTNHGITLTEEGKSIYQDSRRIIDLSRQAIKAAKSITPDKKRIIRLGSSLMCPAHPITNLWYGISSSYPLTKLQIIPIDASYTFDFIENNFHDVDIIASIFPSTLWKNSCNALILRQLPLAISVPINHPLASRQQITFSDLYGETIIIFKPEDKTNRYGFYNTIQQFHHEIHIHYVPPHDFNAFNYAANNGWLMLTVDLWNGIHPSLTTIPFYASEPYTVPYGILYPKNPPSYITDFINMFEQVLRQ